MQFLIFKHTLERSAILADENKQYNYRDICFVYGGELYIFRYYMDKGTGEKYLDEYRNLKNSIKTSFLKESINGFDFADYEKYNSPASDNGLSGTKIYIDGVVKTKLSAENVLAMIVNQEDGKSWVVSVTDRPEEDGYIVDELLEKNIRIFGVYQGYSSVYNMPAIAVADEDGKIETKNENGVFDEAFVFKDYYENRFGINSKDTEALNESQAEDNALRDSYETEPFFSCSGNGDDVVTGVTTDNILYAHIIHNGDGHFAVKGHYDDEYDLLVNTTEPYDGKTLIYPNKEYTFEITARGDWTINLYKIGTSSTDSFSGSSDYVTPIFLKSSNVYEITTTGGGHFAIKGWTDNGYDLLVNTTDENYSGKVMFDNDELYAFFEIIAERDWEIKPIN